MNIQAKPIFRIALLAIAMVMAFALTGVIKASPAEAAVYGNIITEGYGSTANVSVVGEGSSTIKVMRPNTDSYGWPAFVKNVRAFYIPSGYTGVSQWGHGYAGGRWHYFYSSYNHLYIQVESNYCWYLRTQLGTPCKVPVPA